MRGMGLGGWGVGWGYKTWTLCQGSAGKLVAGSQQQRAQIAGTHFLSAKASGPRASNSCCVSVLGPGSRDT